MPKIMIKFFCLPLKDRRSGAISSRAGKAQGHRVEEFEDNWHLSNGVAVRIRVVQLEDARHIQELVHSLSSQSRHQRFFSAMYELSPDMLVRATHAEPLQEFALLAVVQTQHGEVIAGMAQYVAAPYPDRCDFAVVVGDIWQRHGIGLRLMRDLMQIARSSGMKCIEGEILAENEPVRQLLLKLGFSLRPHPGDVHLRMASKRLIVH